MKTLPYYLLVHLVIEIHIDCNLRESNYWTQATFLWMPYKSRDKWQLKYCNVPCVCFTSFLLSNQRWTRWVVCTEQQAAVYIWGQLYTSYKVTVLSLACGQSVKNPGLSYCTPSSADRPQDIRLSLRNWKVSITWLDDLVYGGRAVWRLSHKLFWDK